MKEKILRPTFYNSFSCVASDCKDSCCKGWEIQIDKKTYKKYEKIKSSSLRKEVVDSIELKDKESPFGYGRFKLNNGSCQMLTDGGLCRIHSELGASYLCKTCSMYPRTVTRVGELLEFSLSMSCPEVARIALSQENGIEFELIEENVGNILIRALKTPSDKDDKLNYLFDTRNFVISILQERSVSVENRLMILGLFLEQLDEVTPSQIPFMINSFAEEVVKEGLSVALNAEYDASLVVSIGTENLSAFFKNGVASPKFLSFCTNAFNGYKEGEKYSVYDALNKYQQGRELHYHPFLRDHEYMIENFLVMLVYSNLFPCGYETYKEAFRALASKYLLIKFILIGNALNEGKMGLDDVIDCVYSYYKEVEHRDEAMKLMLEVLDKYKIHALNELFALIKG